LEDSRSSFQVDASCQPRGGSSEARLSVAAQRNCPSTYREVLGRQDSGKKRREIFADTRKCNVRHALGIAGIFIAASRVVFAPSAAQRLLNSSGLSKRSSCPDMPSSHSHNSNSPGPSHGSPSSGAGSVASSRISRRSPRLLRLPNRRRTQVITQAKASRITAPDLIFCRPSRRMRVRPSSHSVGSRPLDSSRGLA
jgi:hypothetical protein